MPERNLISLTLKEAEKEINLVIGEDSSSYHIGETTLLINPDKSLTIIAPTGSGPQTSHIMMHNSEGMEIVKDNYIYIIKNEEGHLEISKSPRPIAK